MKLINIIRSFLSRAQKLVTEEKNENARENLRRNFLKKDDSKKINNSGLGTQKQQSMQDSQGKEDFSGSSYNGPGNVDHEKTNSNMSQRNF